MKIDISLIAHHPPSPRSVPVSLAWGHELMTCYYKLGQWIHARGSKGSFETVSEFVLRKHVSGSALTTRWHSITAHILKILVLRYRKITVEPACQNKSSRKCKAVASVSPQSIAEISGTASKASDGPCRLHPPLPASGNRTSHI